MDYADGTLPALLLLSSWLPLAALALWMPPWRAVPRARFGLWLMASALLAALWMLRASVAPGLSLHFLGAALLYLMFGALPAIWGVALAAAVLAATGRAGSEGLALTVLATGALPVAVVHLVRRAAERWLPPNPFVYFFGVAFLGAGLSVAAAGTASALLHALAGDASLAHLASSFLPFALLLGWGEAFLTGMLATIFVVYRSEWMATFDDARYLRRR